MSNPTPTRHGAWRVIDGVLIDESQSPQREGGPGIAVPPADDDTHLHTAVSAAAQVDLPVTSAPPKSAPPHTRNKRASKTR